MKRYVVSLLLAAATLPAFAADVGVSVTVGQPGFYGRIDIGNAPPPVLIYPQPVVIQRVYVLSRSSRSTCMPPAMHRSGANTATSTTRAAVRCISSRTIGTTTSMYPLPASARLIQRQGQRQGQGKG